MRANSSGTFDVDSEEEAELIRMAPEAIHQQRVRDFHAKFGQPIGERPAFSRPELRARLIAEEAAETVTALLNGDMVEVADGLCDLIYVALGCAVEMGIDLVALFEEIHRSNMTKTRGIERADGKIQKGPTFEPPRVAELLREQGWSG